MRRLSIDEQKQIELEIMDDIDAVCREHGITYFLGYGSLLGAIRHGGFIPWDDDMDIIMMREDYERFFEVFPRAKKRSEHKLISYREKTCPMPFFKVVDTTTLLEEAYASKKYWGGIWVDIFAMDSSNGPDKELEKKFQSLQSKRYLATSDGTSGASPLVRLAKKVLCPLYGAGDGPYKYARMINDLAVEASRNAGSELVVEYSTEPAKVYPVSLFKPVSHAFEDRTYLIPEGYEEYLTTLYGDWQTPPPLDKREMHTMASYRL